MFHHLHHHNANADIKVTIRPATHPNHFLFASNDGVRGFNSDFDVRTHASQEQRNEFLITHVQDNLFTIRSATNPQHYLFASDDGARAYGGDFDVRTHNSANEERNKWIIERHNQGFVIRASTRPNHYLFAANDGSNGYGGDFDVRTHPHQEDRNTWLIDNFSTAPITQKVTIRVKGNPNHYLFPSNDGTRGLGGDFDVRTHPHQEERNHLYITRVGRGVYTIRSAVNDQHYFFPSDDGTRKYGDDFDVRTHPHANEERNKWIIQSDNQGGFLISSATKPNYYLFAANDGSNGLGGDFDVRTHPHQENRNAWIIDNFHLHSY